MITAPFPEALKVNELKLLLDKGVELTILDVREPEELNICSLSGSVNLPLTNLMQNLEQIPRGKPIVTVCHHGIRSRKAAVLLLDQGFKNVANLSGGLHAWAVEIDPEMQTYE